MSNLDKIQIQGIRSFGPNIPYGLQFFSPLTLILGQNGCGKTTIIESLKYITTNELPPGCGRGASFVHDPKMVQEGQVRGKVRLKFKDVKGKVITASKIVEAIQKPRTIQFSSLDYNLHYVTEDGEKKSISNKCSNLPVLMSEHLGVSKPILEHVLFCHQEESNWPLDEGKKVKDKFDAIFNATKYIKCLDTIRKLRKDKTQDIKHKKENLEASRNYKEEVTKTRRDLEETQTSVTSLKSESNDLHEEIVPLNSRVHEIRNIEERASDIISERNKKKNLLEAIRVMQSTIQSQQTEEFTCTDRELENLIEEFESICREENKKLEKMKNNRQDLVSEIKKLSKEESDSNVTIGKLEHAFNLNSENVRNRNRLLRQIIDLFNIQGYEDTQSFNTGETEEIFVQLEEVLKKKENKLSKNKKVFEENELSLDKEIEDLKLEKTTLLHDISSFEKQVTEKTRECRTLKHNVNKYEEELSEESLEDVQKSLDGIERKIKDETRKVDVHKLNDEKRMKEEEVEKFEKELEGLQKKIDRLNRMAEKRSQYDIYCKDKETLERRNNFLINKNKDDIEQIIQDNFEENLKNKFDAQFHSIRRQIKNSREEKNNFERKKTEFTFKIENEKKDINELEKNVQDCEKKIEDVCNGNSLEITIENAKGEVETLNKRKGDYESSNVLFRTFMEKIRSGEGCPLCHRDFDEDYQKDLLIEEIEDKLNRLPERLTEISHKLQQKESFRDKLLQLRPQKESSDKATKEIENRRVQLQSLQNNLKEVNSKLDKVSEHFMFLLSEEETCNRIQADVVVLDTNMKKIKQLKDQIQNSEINLNASENDMSMDELVDKQKNTDIKCKNLKKEIQNINESIYEHKNNLHELNQRKLGLSRRQLELSQKQLEAKKLKDDIEKLEMEKTKLKEKIEDNQVAVAPIKIQMEEKYEEKKKITKDKQSLLDKETKEINEIKEKKRVVSELHESIKAYAERGDADALADFRRKLKRLQERINAKEEEKNQIQERVDKLFEEITRQQKRKRNMVDEKTIREKNKEAEILESEIKILKDRISTFDLDKIANEKENLKRQISQKTIQISRLDGQISELENKAKELENKLNSKAMREAERRFNELFIRIKCMEIAVTDLDKYYNALELAILKFHREKMAHINSIIRGLWKSTYKGNDIDYIEIQAEDTESTGGVDKRRNYNYRVIMFKNKVEIDMRGRCSAGQKVLASLIIRMALAETFSANCGFFALDEPTTNLDRENIEALAEALIDIVNTGSNRRNFQLIIITHDFQFLERLSQSDYVEYYHKVFRDNNGLSVIKTVPINN